MSSSYIRLYPPPEAQDQGYLEIVGLDDREARIWHSYFERKGVPSELVLVTEQVIKSKIRREESR